MTPKPPTPAPRPPQRHWLWSRLSAALCAVLTACGVPPRTTPEHTADRTLPPASDASTPLAYRQDAARHLYAQYPTRIYQGPLPPLLHAVCVVQVNLGPRGEVRSLNWMRKPSHVPEVTREIEQLIRTAAPFPQASKLGYVGYTDTWLWHKSGLFQLDTLTEGQLDFSDD